MVDFQSEITDCKTKSGTVIYNAMRIIDRAKNMFGYYTSFAVAS